MKLFTPDYYVESYRAIDLERLKRQGIALLVCDIDNTLVPHDHARADDDVRAFIKRVKDSGLAVAFVSNNVKERVETFAREFHAPCYPFAKDDERARLSKRPDRSAGRSAADGHAGCQPHAFLYDPDESGGQT